MRKNKFWAVFTLAFIISSNIALALSNNELECGSLQNAFGPFDYRTATIENKKLVESAHFTVEVEQLVRGNTSSTPTGDLHYTLRVFPNHPRALRSLMEWGFRKKTDHPRGAKWPIWCYFDRAIRFQPDDPQVKMVYGMFLQRKGKLKEAAEQLLDAEKLAGDNANLLYNIGLIYLDLGDSTKALQYAHRAYSMNFPLEGLRNRLKRAGIWKDLPPPVETANENAGESTLNADGDSKMEE